MPEGFKSQLIALALWMVVASLAGCAGPPPTSDSDLRLQAATHIFGGSYDYVIVESAGEFKDNAFMTLVATTGPADLSRDLATALAPAERNAVRMLVTGPNREKTMRVVLDALDFHRGRQLPYLELLYLGDPRDERELREVVESLGARLGFAAYET